MIKNFKIKSAVVFLLIFAALLSSSCSEKTEKTDFDYQEMLDYCVEQNVKTIAGLENHDEFPRYIDLNSKEWHFAKANSWISGFWAGVLWYTSEESNNEVLRENAKIYTEKLQVVMEEPVRNHDLGFMLYSSYGNGYRITKDPSYKALLIDAADSLASLYNPKVGTILSWPDKRKNNNWPHHTIIDNMLNLELLFWSAKNGGKKAYYDLAVKHAETTAKYHIRKDSTTYHVVFYNEDNGDFIKGKTHQGYADNSIWARGQAWGVYGFTMCFRETGKTEFKETAMALADAYIKRLPEDLVPYWDFNDPEIPKAPRDASASAIVASGLLELSQLMGNSNKAIYYKEIAVDILKSLSSEKYLSKDRNNSFLMHSTGNKNKNSEVDASIIYADYYYIEALRRLKRLQQD